MCCCCNCLTLNALGLNYQRSERRQHFSIQNKQAWQCIEMTSSSPSACRDTEQENPESFHGFPRIFTMLSVSIHVVFTLALNATTFPI